MTTLAARPEAASASEDAFARVKTELHQQLIASIDLSAIGTLEEDDLRREVRDAAEELCRRRDDLLSHNERERLVNEVLDETFGLGPLEPLLRDPTISDLLVNGARTVYVERHGQLERENVRFRDDRHLLQIIQRIAGRVGRRIDETSPMVDARLADGSRVNAIIPPLALDGPSLSIRRFGEKPLEVRDLLIHHSATPQIIEFLEACVQARINILISGGTGSGKTTLLNVLSRFISENERIVTIEDSAELQLQQPHVVRLETRPANIEGTGKVTQRDLVVNALRMRPDRIVIGECRGPEALDMLQAMNTGHDGSLTTIHANSCRDALYRLETMVAMTGVDLPIWVTRRQIVSAIHLIVQVGRLTGGVRRVLSVAELTGMEGDVMSMQDIFEFKKTGVDCNGVAQGLFRATGIRPQCLRRFEEAGIDMPPSFFEARILEM